MDKRELAEAWVLGITGLMIGLGRMLVSDTVEVVREVQSAHFEYWSSATMEGLEKSNTE